MKNCAEKKCDSTNKVMSEQSKVDTANANAEKLSKKLTDTDLDSVAGGSAPNRSFVSGGFPRLS